MNTRSLTVDIADMDALRTSSPWRIGAAMLAMACFLAFSLITPPADAKDSKQFKSFKLKTLDGQKKTLGDYAGKLTLIGFFYPLCPYCRVSVPQLQSLYDKYKDSGLSVVLINVVEEEDKLIPGFVKEHRISLPILTGAWQPALMRDYDLEATPTHFLLDGKGTVLLRQNGYAPGDEKVLEARIARAAKESSNRQRDSALQQ